MNYYNEIKKNLIKCEVYDKTKDFSKNKNRVVTYFENGKLLNEAGKEYGKNVIKQYSEKLRIEVGKKYNERTLYRMRKFYEVFSNEKLTPLVSKLSWNHCIQLLSLKNVDEINSHETLFIKDLKGKWENAYRNTTKEQAINNLKNKVLFSIQRDINGNKFVNIDVDQDIFDEKPLAEQAKIAKRYILDNFRKKGLLINEDKIDITSRTANEYTHPKNKNSKNVTSSKMRASTELDNLLKISKYSHSDADDGRHNIAKDGWDYYKVHFKVGNQTFEGLINIAKNGEKRTLYDVTRIKKTSRVGSDNMSITTNVMSSYVNNITQSKDDVKLPIKYSTLESQNNTQEKETNSSEH